MIFDRVNVLRFVFRREGHLPRDVARRWQKAFRDEPRLAEDLIRLSGLLELRAERLENGEVMPDPVDPIRRAEERGEQDFAKKLLALMNLTPFDLNQLIGASDVSE